MKKIIQKKKELGYDVVKKQIEQIVEDNIGSVLDTNEPKQDKVVLWDYDSLVYHCLYPGYSEEVDEFGKKIKNPEYTEADLEFLQGKLSEMTLKVLNNI